MKFNPSFVKIHYLINRFNTVKYLIHKFLRPLMARFHRAVRFSTVWYGTQLCPFPLSEVVNGTKIVNRTVPLFWYPSVGVIHRILINLFHTIYCMSSVIFRPASAAASRVFLLSNLGGTKHQNNCSHISR